MLSITYLTSKGADIKLSDFTLMFLCLRKYLRTKLPPRLVPITWRLDFGW